MRVKEAFDAHDAQLAGLLACNTGTVCPNHESSIKHAVCDAMLAVLDEAEAITDYNRLFTEEGVDELYAMPNQDAYSLMRQWVEVRWPALRTRIKELGGNDGQD